MSGKKSYLPQDLNAYDKGVQKGIDLALRSEKLNVKKQNLHNPFFTPKVYDSFSQGLKVGFSMGIKQREYQRLRELSKIQNNSDRNWERQ